MWKHFILSLLLHLALINCDNYLNFTAVVIPTGPTNDQDKIHFFCDANITTVTNVNVRNGQLLETRSTDGTDIHFHGEIVSPSANCIIVSVKQSNTTDDKPACFGMISSTGGADSFYILENSELGTDYIVQTYCDVVGICQFAVAAPDGAEVKITLPSRRKFSDPSCDTRIHSNGQVDHENATTFERNLDKEAVLYIQAECDLTGTRVNSNQPVAVFSGSHSVIVGWGDSTDFMMSQLLPTRYWGTEYIVYPYPHGKGGDIISIVANQENTDVHIVGYGAYMLVKAGDYIRRRISSNRSVRIWASKEIGVAQYIMDIPQKTAAMLIVPPTTRFLISSVSLYNTRWGSNENFIIFRSDLNDIGATEVKKSEYSTSNLNNITMTNSTNIEFWGYMIREYQTHLMATSIGFQLKDVVRLF
ncbi:hypothetical protein FSP39_010008 [Pinctada imbricata]|uniref:IgGFc-binding protein N-terminal domain-containing protein n=1 Tax=Pinctada imbricata TaxID=66713 RepID=A0AA88XY68_PINIB|nr:hypothetical protein FSP39_010008 [Pinctada imbricata]